jgi:putative peptidoglycan lipid II flippase
VLIPRIAAWRSRLLQAHPDHMRIALGALRVAIFVLAGRLAGAAKEMAVAYRYGTSHVVDAYQLTLTLISWMPTAFATAFLIVLVPIFVNLSKEGRSARELFLGELEAWTILLAVLLVTLLFLVWPFALDLLAVNLSQQTRVMARHMMLGMAPVAVVILLSCVYSARLQAHERHMNNLLDGLPAMLILILVLTVRDSESMWPLVCGTTLGFVAQMMLLHRYAKRIDGGRGTLRLSFQSQHWPRIAHAARVFMPGQIVLCCAPALDQSFAAHLGDGTIAKLGYANRVISLLMSVGALAMAQATLPIVSDILNRGDRARARDTAVKWSLLMLAVGTGCAAVSWLLAPQVIALLFERGAFGAEDTVAVAGLFRWGLVQVPFYFAGLVLMTLFASAGRFNVMTFVALLSFAVKSASNFAFAHWFGVSGLLLATGVMHASMFICYMICAQRFSSSNMMRSA